ncbi:MAG: carbohydrate ABC transporter permease [Phycisphaerae bacterium]|nr:carbohydrate ABC transporter permease [Phycisphaerae bacterium]MDW8262354.1 carbohydrate ABC transporter permease [Phycisphaerales bacterium]
MNTLRWILLTVFLAAIPIWLISPRAGRAYLRLSVLLMVCSLMLLPFVWLICAAFKDKSVLNEYTFLPPVARWFPGDAGEPALLNLGNFRELFTPRPTLQGPVSFWRYLVNSLFLASASTVISLFFCSLAGYALAKYRFRGRSIIQTFMLASLMVPGVVFLIPNWEIIWRLGWMDSYLGLIVPGAVSVFGIFLFRQAMLDIPTELIEAGRIDGCSEFRIYLSLVVPLVRPMIGAFCLLTFLGHWNAFLGPNMYLQSQSKLTLPVVLNQYIGVYTQQYGVFLAGTLIAIIPPAILFLSLQREFIAGLQSGALKQ